MPASSVGTDSVVPGLAHYSAAKAGAAAFVQNAALELAPRGSRMHGIRSRFITHEMTAVMGIPDAAVQRLDQRIPAGRTGNAEDIARVVLFPASEDSSYMTGQTLLVDGGLRLENAIDVEDEHQPLLTGQLA